MNDGSFDPSKPSEMDDDELQLPTPEDSSLQPKEAVRDASPGDLNLSKEALATKQKLAKERKVTFIIPLDPGETMGAYRPVTINGYRFEVKKNVMVELPESVAKLLQKSYNTESAVLSQHPLNLDNKPGAKNALS